MENNNVKDADAYKNNPGPKNINLVNNGKVHESVYESGLAIQSTITPVAIVILIILVDNTNCVISMNAKDCAITNHIKGAVMLYSNQRNQLNFCFKLFK